MHFTVHLRSSTASEPDFSYGLVFIPTPVWKKGRRAICRLNRDSPEYQVGSVSMLLECERLSNEFSGVKTAIVLVHQVGHGSDHDLDTLKLDLASEGFDVQIYGSAETKR